MRASIKLFSIIPGVLRFAWALLITGMVLLASGYFTYTPWQSYAGLGFLIFGYVIAVFDMFYRKRHRGEASAFYDGATTSPIIASYFILFIALLGAVVLAVKSLISGYSGAHAIRLLHFLGIIFAFIVVSGIPGPALRAQRKKGTEHDVAEQPANVDESK